MKEIEYDIISDQDGSKFCRCRHLENGAIQLIGKNGSMPLTELQMKAYDPKIGRENRGKKHPKRRMA